METLVSPHRGTIRQVHCNTAFSFRRNMVQSTISTRYCKRLVLCQKGFGSVTNKQKPKKKNQGPFKQGDTDWVPVAKLSAFQGKQIKVVELKDKSIVALYNVDDQIYCSDANSTAYKFPLANAKVIQRDEGPAIEVALDGTIYDLGTGKVLEWCPKNNPLRAVLGALKMENRLQSADDKQDLQMYQTHLDKSTGQVYVKFK